MKITKGTFLLLAYSICMLAMVSDYKVLSNQVGAITTLLTWVYLLYNKNYRYTSFEETNVRYLLFFLGYFTITSIFSFNPGSWFTSIVFFIIIFTPFFLYAHLFHTNNTALMKCFVVCFFIIWNIFLVLCFITCYTIPDLARLMAADRPSFVNIINGGGYPMGYGSAILSTYLLSCLINKKYKGWFLNLFFIADIVLMVMTILVINSFIILLSTLAGFLFVTINHFSFNKVGKVVVYLFAGIFLLVVYLNLGNALFYLSRSVDNDFWNRRFTELYESVELSNNSAHIDNREHVYDISIEGFLRSPLLGNGYKYGNVFNNDEANGVGNHSSFLDTLAQYGIIGALPIFLFLLYPLRKKKEKGEDRSYLIPFYVMFCLNPCLRCYHIMLIIFLIIPSMRIIENKVLSTC